MTALETLLALLASQRSAGVATGNWTALTPEIRGGSGDTPTDRIVDIPGLSVAFCFDVNGALLGAYNYQD